MNKNNSLQKIGTKIYKNPTTKAVQAFIEDVPGVGSLIAAGRAALEQKLSNMQEERRAVFLDELDKGGLITAEMLEKDEFIHSLLVVYRAAINTYQHEKIRRFARILLTAVEKDELASDKFEEYIRILDSTTVRELYILKNLKSFEVQSPHQLTQNGEMENDPQRSGRFWDRFESQIEVQLGISSDLLRSILTGMNRTGLYESFIGAYLGYQGGQGQTTSLYQDFIEWIKLESDEDNSSHPKDKI